MHRHFPSAAGATLPAPAATGATKPGDVVVVSGHRVGERERVGEIVEVLGEPDHAHYRVRWDDGHDSIFYPSVDTIVRHAT
jgi:chitodextrinase